MFHLFSQAGASTKPPYATYEKLLDLVEGRDKKEYLLLDVRTAEEYESGHIPGPSSYPMTRLAPRNPMSRKIGWSSSIAAQEGVPNWRPRACATWFSRMSWISAA